MLTLVTLVALLSGALGFAWAAQWLIDEAERRRLGRVVAQVHVTDAVHAALGAVVAPTVARHRGRSWTVVFVPRAEYPVSRHHGFLRAA